MIHHWKVLHLEIKNFEYQRVRTLLGEIIPSQTSNLKHVEIIKILDKRTCDASLESS